MPKKTQKKPVNKNAGRGNDTNRATEKKNGSGKNASRWRDIVMLVVIAVCILSVIAMFTSAIGWLKTALYFLFGLLMYASPLFILVLFIILFYHEKSAAFVRRLIAAILILFALSGIFAFAVPDAEHAGGGLLGRLNYLMFHAWLGSVGAYVVNALLIAIGAALMTDFSLFQFIKERAEISRENRELKKAIREREELEREAEELEERRNTSAEIEKEKNRAEAYRKYLDEKQDAEEKKRERFETRYVGIGDTRIVDDGPSKRTVFKSSEEELVKPSYPRMNEDPEEDIPFDETPLQETNTEKDFPKINFGQSFFEREEKEPKEPALSTDEDEEYTKVVITKTGKAVKVSDDFGAGEAQAPVKPAVPAANETRQAESDGHQMTIPEVISETAKEYQFPPLRLLQRGGGSSSSKAELQRELNDNAMKLKQTLETFGVGVTVTNISCGPTVTRYEIQPDIGIRVSKIVNLQDDIQLSMAAGELRIEAPIPGKSSIGIEIPNKTKTGVTLRDLLESEEFQKTDSKLAYGLGKDVDGRAIVSDLGKMPHLLVAGTTGSGKSVCLNTMIMSVLFHAKPTEVKMIMIDPKMVEFAQYNGIPHLLLPVITDPKKASMALSWAVAEMDRRYEAFSKYGVRDINGFNQYVEMEQPEDESGIIVRPMPRILIFVDEFADLIIVSPKDVEALVVRLAQKARAAGIHLVLATQSPRADVLTGLIKVNIPSRIALAVSSGLESRIIMDMNGAETLLGHGDMLYIPIGANKPLRIQGAYVSDDEIRDVVNYIKKSGPVKGGGFNDKVDLNKPVQEEKSGGGSSSGGRDELFETVGRFVIEKQKASIGALQRAFSIGFNRAARIMDQLADAGVVGEEEGTKPRRILMNMAQFEALLKNL